MTMDEIRSQALSLPPHERELLAINQLGSLSSEECQIEMDEIWEAEIAARSEAVRTGRSETLDAQESLERVRAQLAARAAN